MRIFGLHTGGRYCLLFCHKSGTIVPQPHKKCLWKQTDKRNCNTTDPRSAIANCKEKIQMFLSEYTTIPSMPPHIRTLPQTKRKKMQTFPVSKAAAKNSLSGKMLLYANCSKIHIFNIRQRSPVLYFNRFARKTPTKNTGRNRHPSFFTHAPHTLFFSLCVFLLIQKIFICQKCRNCFGIL